MTRPSIANRWIMELKSRKIETYEFNDLPDDLKSLSTHRKAISEGLVEKIVHRRKVGSIWRIKN